MTRSTLFILGTVLSLNCWADTAIVFSSNQARVSIQGNQGDLDAPKLYEAMNVSASSNGTQNQKQISFQDKSNQTVFELVCATSQNVANFGSCSLHIVQQANMVFDPSHQKFVIAIQDSADLANVSKLFQRPASDGFIYSSNDGKLSISLSHTNSTPTFVIEYN